MSKESGTNWKKLAKMKDEDIDLTEMPELDDAFFNQAELHVPPKQAVTMRLDADVLEWFREQGKGYQTRINRLLRAYMVSQQRRHS
ncbi:BrnA antitoxin family protein [Caballeronia sp. BR00000012568055]|uniref:BrnA antitoxin family protein n=1 Tax=Caballeronia sp. BR00000012568055 TaxID=2918761 RepID=UPI0023F89FD6|nr:BrnA antitoxin family protein [Caballeronia sp. BR00000012568055]